jgi:hypothetical protein
VVYGLRRHDDLSAGRAVIQPRLRTLLRSCGPFWHQIDRLHFCRGVPVVLARSLPLVLASGLLCRVTGGLPVKWIRGKMASVHVASKLDHRAGGYRDRDPRAGNGHGWLARTTPC